MNAELIVQIEQLFQWGVAGLLKWKDAQGNDEAWVPVFRAALAESRPMTVEEWAPLEAQVDAATQAALNA